MNLRGRPAPGLNELAVVRRNNEHFRRIRLTHRARKPVQEIQFVVRPGQGGFRGHQALNLEDEMDCPDAPLASQHQGKLLFLTTAGLTCRLRHPNRAAQVVAESVVLPSPVVPVAPHLSAVRLLDPTHYRALPTWMRLKEQRLCPVGCRVARGGLRKHSVDSVGRDQSLAGNPPVLSKRGFGLWWRGRIRTCCEPRVGGSYSHRGAHPPRVLPGLRGRFKSTRAALLSLRTLFDLAIRSGLSPGQWLVGPRKT